MQVLQLQAHRVVSFQVIFNSLSKQKNMTQLLDFIITMPKEGDTHERAHKLPFLISDIFAQENNSLLDSFFDDQVSDEEESEEAEEMTKDTFESEIAEKEEMKEEVAPEESHLEEEEAKVESYQ